MPADGIPSCQSPRTETSARPVSKSSSKEDYRIPRPSKRPSYGQDVAPTIGSRPMAPMSELGQKAKYSLRADVFRFAPNNGHPQQGRRVRPVRLANSALTTDPTTAKRSKDYRNRKRDASRCDDRDATSPTEQRQIHIQRAAVPKSDEAKGQQSDLVVRLLKT